MDWLSARRCMWCSKTRLLFGPHTIKPGLGSQGQASSRLEPGVPKRPHCDPAGLQSCDRHVPEHPAGLQERINVVVVVVGKSLSAVIDGRTTPALQHSGSARSPKATCLCGARTLRRGRYGTATRRPPGRTRISELRERFVDGRLGRCDEGERVRFPPVGQDPSGVDACGKRKKVSCRRLARNLPGGRRPQQFINKPLQ